MGSSTPDAPSSSHPQGEPPASPRRPAPASPRFATTHWSLVLAAGRHRPHVRPPTQQSQQALAILCETYWYPLYAYIRRRGYSADDAQDLVQEFFVYLLDQGTLETADRERGRFRTFLLTILQRFLAREHERSRAQKRGGNRRLLSIDVESAEDRYRREPFHELTPERIYERRWALTVLERGLTRLEAEYTQKDKAALFNRLKHLLTGHDDGTSYREIATDLGITEAAVKVAVHRLRRRYRALLREEIAHTVGEPSDVKDELDALLRALQPDV